MTNPRQLNKALTAVGRLGGAAFPAFWILAMGQDLSVLVRNIAALCAFGLSWNFDNLQLIVNRKRVLLSPSAVPSKTPPSRHGYVRPSFVLDLAGAVLFSIILLVIGVIASRNGSPLSGRYVCLALICGLVTTWSRFARSARQISLNGSQLCFEFIFGNIIYPVESVVHVVALPERSTIWSISLRFPGDEIICSNVGYPMEVRQFVEDVVLS